MALSKSLAIRQLESADVAALAEFMRSQSSEYLHFFYAFGADESLIAEMLADDKLDVYSGVFWQNNLVGIFFLRGWDEGFEIPSFGVLIDDKYRGGAFFRLTLDSAKLICRLSNVKTIMIKGHPDNASVRVARRFGMRQIGFEEKTGNIIYHLEL